MLPVDAAQTLAPPLALTWAEVVNSGLNTLQTLVLAYLAIKANRVERQLNGG
jgi:hypothetical protein